MFEALLLLSTALIFLYYFSVKRPKNYPPGPKMWPFVGNIHQAKTLRHETFMGCTKIYGDIIGVHFGSVAIVILNNYKHICEAFSENLFAGRPQNDFTKERNFGGNRGVLFADGKTSSEQRRSSIKNIKDFGFGKKSMEALIMEEVKELIRNFRKEAGKPISSQNRFNIAVLNALWSMLSGERHCHDDPRLTKLMEMSTEAVRHKPISLQLAECFPTVGFLRKALPFLFEDIDRKFLGATYAFIDDAIKQHEDTLQEDSPRDFIDVYLTEMRNTSDPKSTFYKKEGGV